MRELIDLLPNTACLQRYLTYCYIRIDDVEEALKWYTRAARISHEIQGWHSIVALSVKIGDTIKACMALENIFSLTPITDDLDRWYIFIRLLQKQKRYQPLGKLLESKKHTLSKAEEVLFLETFVYLLKYTGREKNAHDIIYDVLEGKADYQLILAACNQLMEQSITSSHSQNEVASRKSIEVE